MNLILKMAGLGAVVGMGNLAAAGDEVFDLKADRLGAVRFWGSTEADLFTREIAESYAGVLSKNYVSDTSEGFPVGFVRASVPKFYWWDTFWTRDGGTFLRELVMWGNMQHACQTAACLMAMVDKNPDGFYSFPEYFRAGDKKAGTEMDGTASIVIGMVMLWERLPASDPFRAKLYDFLHGTASPARYIQHELSKGPLIAGSGEFGGGAEIHGDYCNVVQNSLAMLALTAAARMETEAGDKDSEAAYLRDAQTIRDNMDKYLVDADGAWIWCIDPKTLKPDPAVLNDEINKGFGGLNGVACMYSDVLGMEPLASKWEGIAHCEKTFEKLYAFPLRKEQFEKYGMWTQFDVFRAGRSSGASYGDGYALQTMLLYDKMEMADKSVAWLANSTFKPVPEYHLDRSSPYYFYERSYTPDAVGKTPLDQGCGALNLVNVTEPLKIARLILGVDDTALDEVRIIPRIPPSWKGVEAKDWPIRTSKGMVRAWITCERTPFGLHFAMVVKGGKIPRLAVRLEGKWVEREDVTALVLEK